MSWIIEAFKEPFKKNDEVKTMKKKQTIEEIQEEELPPVPEYKEPSKPKEDNINIELNQKLQEVLIIIHNNIVDIKKDIIYIKQMNLEIERNNLNKI